MKSLYKIYGDNMPKCFKRINLENATKKDVLEATLDLIQTCVNGHFVLNKTEITLINRFLDRYQHLTREHNILLFPWASNDVKIEYLGYPIDILNKIFNYQGQVLTREELDWLLNEKFDLKFSEEEWRLIQEKPGLREYM